LAPHVTLQSAQAQAAKAQPLAEHGTNQHREDFTTSNPPTGNSQTYLLRRIARDQPELLDQIGEEKPYRSARAAAIAAGIIKPVPTIRLVDDITKVASALRRHLSPEQISSLMKALASTPSPSQP